MDSKKCKSCAALIPKNTSTCPNCGRKFGFPKPGLVVIGLVFLALLIGVSSKNDNSKKPAAQQSANSSANSLPPEALTPDQHLSEAKKALADGYKPQKDIMKRAWGRVDDAKKHLALIPQNSQEWGDAEKLRKEVARREKEIEKAANVITRTLIIQQRKKFAEQYESALLDKGLDVHATVVGGAAETLKIKWVLISRPLVHKLTNDSDFISKLRNLGFKKLILSDGYDSSWSVNL